MKTCGVDDAAGADHARRCRVMTPVGIWRILYVSPPTTIVWPGVGAALVAADEVGLLREQVDDLALALVAPLRPDDDGRGHVPGAYPVARQLPGYRVLLLCAGLERRARRTAAGRSPSETRQPVAAHVDDHDLVVGARMITRARRPCGSRPS